MKANHTSTALGCRGETASTAGTEGASRRDRLTAPTKLSGHRTLYLGTLENPTITSKSRWLVTATTDPSAFWHTV
jgi:hypothetical protein